MPPRVKTILLVDDSSEIRLLIKRILLSRRYAVAEARTGHEGYFLACKRRPDLILMDWVLGSNLNGIDICARLKSSPETRAIPIIIMSAARVRFDDELQALRHGADLFLTKNSILDGTKETSRFFRYVRSLLNRPFRLKSRLPVVSDPGDLLIDPANHTVRVGGEIITDLPTKLFDLLYVLAKRHPSVTSRQTLVRKVWSNAVQDREVDVAVCRLKARIEKEGTDIIEAVVGKGYRLQIAPFITS